MRRTTKLRNLINDKNLTFIMEAHNGLSAKISEQAGFEALWASSLSISASFGVRDTNEASWTQIMEVLEFMSDATTVPILLDGDTGYGNFNNARRLVRKCEQRQIAGVCMEDKLFPKANSLLEGEQQPLADCEEFCGKIKATKDAQTDDDFIVVARVEAFIAGWGLKEAVTRAEAYRQAGADAILMHSKMNTCDEIDAFMNEWAGRHPVVIVPTNYHTTPTDHFREIGVSSVIWANHSIRSSMTAIKSTVETIKKEESLVNVEPNVVSVKDLFSIVDMKELKSAEKRYLPSPKDSFNAIILAASQGKPLGELTNSIPKTLLTLNSKPILEHQIDLFHYFKIKDISVVRGFQKEKIELPNISFVDNDDFADTKDLFSLHLTRDAISGPTIISYGDIVYQNYAVEYLLENHGDITILVDPDIRSNQQAKDLVLCSKPYLNDFSKEPIHLKSMNESIDSDRAHGQWTGILVLSEKGSRLVSDELQDMEKLQNFKSLSVVDLLDRLAGKTSVNVVYIRGGWIGVNEVADYEEAQSFLK